MADTRKDKRAPVSLKVRFKSATVDEFIEHYSKDVSRGGIYIKSSSPMAVGTLLKFQFQLKDESALIKGVGRVVWTRAEVDATADAPAGMGIKFIKMDDDSRAMVERIVDGNASDPGSYVSGRVSATSAEPISSAPPSPLSTEEGGSFFPDLPPAELPPPEDRTAVRHATQFLADALREGTDEAAAAEAAAKAEQAKKRQAEVEAQRKAESDAKKEAQRVAASGDDGEQPGLPSMIIDPSLEPRAGRPSEAAREAEETPLPRPPVAVGQPDADDSSEPDTEPPPAAPEDVKAPTTSIPNAGPEPKRSALPMIALAAVLVIAVWVALRGGPTDKTVEEGPVAEPLQPAPAPSTIAPAPEPTPEPEQAAAPPEAPAVGADAAAPVEPAPTAALEVQKVAIEVAPTPREAEIFVGGEKRGQGTLSVELPVGVESTVSARAKNYLEASQTVTPTAGKKQPSIKLKLKLMPFIVHVETTPAGASINVAGVKGTTPTDLTLDKQPTQELSVTAKLDGYERALARIAPSEFSASDNAMRAQLSLTLQAKVEGKQAAPPDPTSKRHSKKTTSSVSAPSAKPAGASEPSPAPAEGASEPAPEQPKPESKPEPVPEEPKPSEPLPGNPFGN